jgi:hypothetical protein
MLLSLASEIPLSFEVLADFLNLSVQFTVQKKLKDKNSKTSLPHKQSVSMNVAPVDNIQEMHKSGSNCFLTQHYNTVSLVQVRGPLTREYRELPPFVRAVMVPRTKSSLKVSLNCRDIPQ